MTYRRLMIVSFLLNCFLATATKAISEFGMTASISLVLLVMYALGALMALATMIRSRSPLQTRNLLVGLMGGFGTAAGMGANMTAASILPGYQVFPLVNGGTLVLVALAGRLIFREKIGPYGVAGIVAGVGAIVLLST